MSLPGEAVALPTRSQTPFAVPGYFLTDRYPQRKLEESRTCERLISYPLKGRTRPGREPAVPRLCLYSRLVVAAHAHSAVAMRGLLRIAFADPPNAQRHLPFMELGGTSVYRLDRDRRIPLRFGIDRPPTAERVAILCQSLDCVAPTLHSRM
jgi:hypothetical protein